jgi:macrophage erythroblast attacher
MFRAEVKKIFRFSTHTAFGACLQVGIAAHKSNVCAPDPKSRCVVCRELFELADGLPCAHVENSRLICAKTGEHLNDKNPPIILPNGFVYGEHAIQEMITGNKIVCPRSGNEFNINQAKKLYIL